MIKTTSHTILTSEYNQYFIITDEVEKAVAQSGVTEGIVTVITRHTTTGVTTNEALECLDSTIAFLEKRRLEFVETRDKKYWEDLIQLLPTSYNQKRTVTMNYENLVNMYYARYNHKLAEWREYCAWIETLPMAREWILVKERIYPHLWNDAPPKKD